MLFVDLVRRSSVVRDSSPPQPLPGQRKPYSLARLQVAFWFFLVVAAFLLIWCITGDYDTITEQALILIGIGTGTALGAAAIDKNKRATADEKLAALRPRQAALATTIAELQVRLQPQGGAQSSAEELATARTELATRSAEQAEVLSEIRDAEAGLTKPVSTGFWDDILSDVNGVSFHRFQMVVWTLVLGFLFCEGVYRALAMPEFTATQLALMGISAGTYLGFKIPERQT
jgi:hypothetical protein